MCGIHTSNPHLKDLMNTLAALCMRIWHRRNLFSLKQSSVCILSVFSLQDECSTFNNPSLKPRFKNVTVQV